MADNPKFLDRPVLFIDSAPWMGGAQRSLLTVIRAVAEGAGESAGRVHLLGAAVCSAARGLRIALTRLESPGHWPLSPRGLWRFLGDVRRNRPGIAAAVAAAGPEAILHANSARAVLLLRACGVRNRAMLLHARDVRGPPGWLRRRLGRNLTGLIAVSRYVLNSWAPYLSSRVRTAVIPNGFDFVEIAESARPSQSPWPGGKACIVLAADLVRWKNHRLFLEAFDLVRRRRPEARAVVVGRLVAPESAALLDGLRRFAEARGLRETAAFVTGADNGPAWIAGGDVLVSAAVSEPFGRTVIEALILGRPVAAVRGGGPEEILEDCPAAFLTEPTPEALARGVLEALAWAADPAESARDCARRYEIGRIVPELLRFYRGLPAR